jgi:hypothetical protein
VGLWSRSVAALPPPSRRPCAPNAGAGSLAAASVHYLLRVASRFNCAKIDITYTGSIANPPEMVGGYAIQASTVRPPWPGPLAVCTVTSSDLIIDLPQVVTPTCSPLYPSLHDRFTRAAPQLWLHLSSGCTSALAAQRGLDLKNRISLFVDVITLT